MKVSLLQKLACPFDKSDLHLTPYRQEGDAIIEGLFTCPSCQRYYPIIYGIPIMSPDEYRQQELELPLLQRWGVLPQHNADGFRLLKAPTPNPDFLSANEFGSL